MNKVREPAVAGMFYPGREKDLRDQLKLLFDVTVDIEKFDKPFGIVVPHAGYAYSGKTAAFGYSALRGKDFNTVIIISPSHREYFAGSSVFSGEAYKTPLGLMTVNKEVRKLLVENSKSIFEGIEGHRSEHALEVQLPFLQYLFGNISIVPVVLGDQRKVYVDELAKKINEAADEKTLVVASSDLSHFYTKQEANEFDSIVAENIDAFDYDRLQYNLENEKCFACGGGGIVSLLKAAEMKGYTKSKVLHRSDSGDTTGDHSEVVGYLSAVVYE